MRDRRRLLENLEFPRYAFVPGHTPHPRRANDGEHSLPEPPDEASAILFGLDLFNHGYFWEAHEVWEMPWRAAAQGSDRRLFLKALIRLAAAALKLRLESAAGMHAHASWCTRTFADLARRHAAIDGLAPVELAEFARALDDDRLVLHRQAGLPQPVFDRELSPAGPS